MQKGQTPQII